MKKLLMMIGAAAVAVGANAGTVTTNGVTWMYTALDATAKTISLDGATTEGDRIDAATFPGTLVIDDVAYTVTMLSDKAFNGNTKLKGVLAIPDSITDLGGVRIFTDCTGLTGVSSFGGLKGLYQYLFLGCSNLKGPLPSFSTFTTMNDSDTYVQYATFRGCSSLTGVCLNLNNLTFRTTQAFHGCTALKVLLFGPKSRGSYLAEGKLLTGVTGCKVVVPRAGWDGLVPGGTGTDTIYYGSDEGFDLSIDETNRVVTTTPVTEAGLLKVLELAPLFKTHLGLNTRVNVTNTIEVSSGSITSEMLEAVEFNTLLLTFAVTTQEQLDALLDAFPATTYPMLAIEVKTSGSGKTEKLTLPSDRKLWVALPGDGVYTPKYNGLVISFH